MKKTLLILALVVGVSLVFTSAGFASDDGQSPHSLTVGPRAGSSGRPQGSLTTLFASNNGYAGNMFDIVANFDMQITAIDINTAGVGTNSQVDVWYRDGTSVGHESSSTGWTLIGSFSGTGMGTDQHTFIDMYGNGVTFLANQTYGIYVDLTSYGTGGDRLNYTNGGPKVYSNADLSLTTNCGKGIGFSGSTFYPRQWNGTIYYDDAGPMLPRVDIKVNGEDSGVQIYEGDNAKIDFTVTAGIGAGYPVDIWVALKTPFGFFTYDGIGPYFGWNFGLGNAYYTGPLADITATALDHSLPLGAYKAFVGIDTVANGVLNMSAIYTMDMADFDVVQAPRVYMYDDGSTENLLAWTSGGDMCWLHRFNAYVGGETITEIHAIWGSAMYPGYNPGNGTPATVYVWDDPTEDGDPNDAVLVATEPTTVQNVDTDIYNIIPLTTPPTIVDEFYFGAMQTHVIGQYVAPIDQTTPYVWGNGFFCGTNTPGGFDPANLGGNQYPPAEWGNYWCVRAGY